MQVSLQPLVRILDRTHLPRAIGALLVMLLVIGSIAGLVALLSVPATSWAEKLPDGIPRLQGHLSFLKGPLQRLQEVSQQAAQVTVTPAQDGPTIAVREDSGLTVALLAGARKVFDGLFTTVLVLYFLLVSGDIFLRRFVEILPTFSDKRQAVTASRSSPCLLPSCSQTGT